ncbi:MAG: outer membrane beta-barrel protein [Gemmatimonadota bacterium]|nr:outer membrane beta-barrel protein [Gemmatimonadota bacterium]
MRRRSFVFLAVFAAGLLAGPAHAQHEGTIGLAVSIPHGELDENTDTGFGFAGSYTYALTNNRSVSIGGAASFLTYGNTERRVPLSTTIPDIRVDVETSNNMGFLQGLLQLKAPAGAVNPYGQLSGGLAWFSTTTTLRDTRFDEEVISDTNQSDATWVLGAGGGLQVHVWTGEPGPGYGNEPPSPPARAYVDVGARYQWGGEVEYLREGSLVTPGGELEIDPVVSEIELTQITLGVTFEF